MKSLIKMLICLLELLQKFPYKKVIESLKQKLLEESEVSQNVILPKALFTLKNNGILINGIEIINKKAEIMYKILYKLLEQHIVDTLEGKKAEDFTPFNVNEISQFLENHGIEISDVENQIRRQISRLRKIIRIKLNIFPDDIIESIRWKGINDKTFGYRLNPENITFITQTK
jgi:hypothetical protein